MTLVERLRDRADPDPATGEYDLCPQDISLLTESANKHIEQAQRIEELEEELASKKAIYRSANESLIRLSSVISNAKYELNKV